MNFGLQSVTLRSLVRDADWWYAVCLLVSYMPLALYFRLLLVYEFVLALGGKRALSEGVNTCGSASARARH